MPSIEGLVTRPRRDDAADPPLAGSTTATRVAPWRDRRGRACCSSTVWASTPAATSTSASGWPRPGSTCSAYDHRGKGGSGGRRGDVDRWSHATTTTWPIDWARCGRMRPARPVVLYGHSIGGLIVAGYLLTDRPKPGLVVLTSPALDSHGARLEALAGARPRHGSRPTSGASPTGSTARRCRAIRRSRAKNGGRPAVRQGEHDPVRRRGVRRAAARPSRSRPAASACPTLVLHGEDDGLVPVVGIGRVRGRPGVERRTYPGLRHELHNEPEGRGRHRQHHRLAAGRGRHGVAEPAPVAV